MPKQESLLNQLTTGLMNTFLHINQEYYYHNRIQSNVKRKQVQCEISNTAYYEYKCNECLNNRYIIQSSIGKGSFGEVVLAWDKELNKQVAIKIIRSGDLFLQQSSIEVQIYQLLQKQEDPDRQYIVQLLDSFMYNGHRCLVFEQLHYNLFDILSYNDFTGIDIHHVQRIAYELLCALRYIHSDKNKIIHSDVKPENILLTEHNGCDIKLIDFGSSSYFGSCIFSYIQSRYYRAPEVILGLPYNSAIDMWSVGCVLYEMCTGVPLFRGRNELEQLTLITNVLGEPPLSMLINGKKVEDFYLRTRIRDDGNSRYFLRRTPQLIPDSLFRSPSDLLTVCNESSKDYELYYELEQLLWKLLSWNAENRPTAEQALQSSFFKLNNFNKKKDSKEYRDYQLLHKEKKQNPHPERSCESLSLFLQTRNQPANLHPSTPSLSPYDIAKPVKSSPERIDSSKRKHKRYKTTPLTRADSAFTHSPLQVSFFSPSFTPPAPDKEIPRFPSRLVLSSRMSASSTDTSFSIPFKKLTPADYQTPPPVCKQTMVSHSVLYQKPFPRSGRSSTIQIDSHLLHPPSFDDVLTSPSLGKSSDALSPFQIPLHSQYSNTDLN